MGHRQSQRRIRSESLPRAPFPGTAPEKGNSFSFSASRVRKMSRLVRNFRSVRIDPQSAEFPLRPTRWLGQAHRASCRLPVVGRFVIVKGRVGLELALWRTRRTLCAALRSGGAEHDAPMRSAMRSAGGAPVAGSCPRLGSPGRKSALSEQATRHEDGPRRETPGAVPSIETAPRCELHPEGRKHKSLNVSGNQFTSSFCDPPIAPRAPRPPPPPPP